MGFLQTLSMKVQKDWNYTPLSYIDCWVFFNGDAQLISYKHFIFPSLHIFHLGLFYWLPKSFQEYEINFSFQSSHSHFAYLAALLQNLSVIKEYSVLPCTTSGTSQVTLVVKNPSVSADVASIPGSGRSPGGSKATHSSILAWRVPKTRGAWQAAVCRVSVSQT